MKFESPTSPEEQPPIEIAYESDPEAEVTYVHETPMRVVDPFDDPEERFQNEEGGGDSPYVREEILQNETPFELQGRLELTMKMISTFKNELHGLAPEAVAIRKEDIAQAEEFKELLGRVMKRKGMLN